jgi:hypothetical protein
LRCWCQANIQKTTAATKEQQQQQHHNSTTAAVQQQYSSSTCHAAGQDMAMVMALLGPLVQVVMAARSVAFQWMLY